MRKLFAGFSQNVIILSIVSFLNDIGGETIKKTIPLYLTNVLGLPASIVGLVEGVADATPQLFQPISGYLSDLFGKRKPLVIFGQGLRSCMMFLIAATTWPQILFLRFLDRSGKGISNAPRDALISTSSEPAHVGRSFGLNRMFDNGGAVVGLVLASLILLLGQRGSFLLTHETFHSIVYLAVVPLFLSLFLLTFFLKDTNAPVPGHSLVLHDRLGNKYYAFLLISFFFTLGNSSDAFLILKAQLVGLPAWQIFLLLAGYSLVSSLSGLPLSSLSDRIGRKKLLIAGWLLYGIVYALFGLSQSVIAVVILFLFYGFYYGLTEGSAKAFVSDIVPEQKRGTAFGLYNMVTGVTVFFASLVAGYLWQTFSPGAAFYFGSVMAFGATAGLLFLFKST